MRRESEKTVLACLVSLAIASSPSIAQNVQIGDSVALGDGFVYVWVESDDSGAPVRIGTTLDERVLSSTPNFFTQDWLILPDLDGPSIWEHVLFDWNPAGHGPQMYSVPHFDIHFSILPRFFMDAIENGQHTVAVAPELIPPGYEPDSNPPFAFENMGVHYVDKAAREWNGQPFTETVIFGYYDGDFIFVEPMITREYLLTKTTESIAIKQPAEYARPGYYPTSYRIEYDEDAAQHHVVLTDFVQKAAVSTETYDLPGTISIAQNYPNPVSSTTRIQFRVAGAERVRIEVFDMLGRRVATLVDEEKGPGLHEVTLDAVELESGIYLYRMMAGGFIRTRTMHVVSTGSE